MTLIRIFSLVTSKYLLGFLFTHNFFRCKFCLAVLTCSTFPFYSLALILFFCFCLFVCLFSFSFIFCMPVFHDWLIFVHSFFTQSSPDRMIAIVVVVIIIVIIIILSLLFLSIFTLQLASIILDTIWFHK